MRSLSRFLSIAVLVLSSSQCLGGEYIDGGVVQIRLPKEDVVLHYVERRGGMTVELKAESASVEGRQFYVGDGKMAVELTSIRDEGIMFQGSIKLSTGFTFKKGAVVKVLPGYKKATDLAPGVIYITLPAVTFAVPDK